MSSTSWRNSGRAGCADAAAAPRSRPRSRPGFEDEHEDAVAHQHRLLDVVRHHQDRLDRHAAFAPEVDQVGAQRLGGQHVERRERLVHQQHVGMHDQRAGEADALAHAAGQLLGIGGFEAVEADQVDRLQARACALVARHALRLQAELDVVVHGQPGEQREALEHHRDALGRAVDRLAAIADLARGRARQAGDDAQQASTCRSRSGRAGRRSRPSCRVSDDVVEHRRAGFAGALGDRSG